MADSNTLQRLMALTPLDGRYAAKTRELAEIFSEYGLIRRRVTVEINWLLQLSREAAIGEVPPLSPDGVAALTEIDARFDVADAEPSRPSSAPPITTSRRWSTS
jgi:adenylosuccinate lyase